MHFMTPPWRLARNSPRLAIKELPRLLCYNAAMSCNMIALHVDVHTIDDSHFRFIFIIVMSLHISCTHRIIPQQKREGGKNKLQNFCFFFLRLPALCIYLFFCARLLPQKLRIHTGSMERKKKLHSPFADTLNKNFNLFLFNRERWIFGCWIFRGYKNEAAKLDAYCIIN